MKIPRILPFLPAFLACCTSAGDRSPAGFPPVRYPETPTVAKVDTYHGVFVADPYRWLEDDRSAETSRWVDRQNALTESVLAELPARERLRVRLAELWNYSRQSPPVRHGSIYAWSHNDGLQKQDVLCVSREPLREPRVLLDPNGWSADGTVSLGGWSFSRDGRLVAYSISEAGSDWRTIRVRDVETGEDLPDRIDWVKFSAPSWKPDGSGSFYGRFPVPSPGEALVGLNRDMRILFHRIGTDPADDRLVYERPGEPKLTFSAVATEDGRWLVLTTRRGEPYRNTVHVRPLDEDDAPLLPIDDTWEVDLSYVANDGSRLYFVTTAGAPQGRIVAVDAGRPGRENWMEVVPEQADRLRSARMFGDRFLLTYLRDAADRAVLRSRETGEEREIDLPGLGSVSGFGGDRSSPETFFAFRSFTEPDALHRLDLEAGEVRFLSRPRLPFDREGIETRQVFFESRDGTRVPMFLVHRRDVPRDGNRPVYLFGYGGFDISLTPRFDVALIPFLERGGVYAQPSLRGGGEFGEPWHRAGMLAKKQNVFDDFLAAAGWLVASGLTRPERIAIGGRSNGGLLVGAAITQRPDLFGCALPAVGVHDMLRYHRFTIGWSWVGEYGSSDDAEQFRTLHEYSPLHRVRPGTRYPPTLVLTGDHDDRVVPAHSFKFAAALQAAQTGEAPVLLRVESRAGHGGGRPLDRRIEEAADLWAFAFRALGME